MDKKGKEGRSEERPTTPSSDSLVYFRTGHNCTRDSHTNNGRSKRSGCVLTETT